MADSTAVVINIPPLSTTMTEGSVTKWRVVPGQSVTTGQVIADIETDKSVLEFESPVDGVVSELLVEAGGAPLEVGTPIARIVPSRDDDGGPGPALQAVEPHTTAGSVARPWSATRRRIAERLGQAARDIPHFHIRRNVPIRWLNALREQRTDGARVTLTEAVVRATARALRENPELNITYAEEGAVPVDGTHVAIAIDTPEGVVAPVVRHADRLDPSPLAEAVRDLRARASRRALPPSAFDAAAITVSNLGMYDVDSFVGIITPPQIFLLCVGAASTSPRAAGSEEQSAVLPCTLVCDHRAVDGAPAARLLASLAAQLEAAPF